MTLKMNVIDDDIPLLLRIEAIEKVKVTLHFSYNLMMTPEMKFNVNQIECWTSEMKSYGGSKKNADETTK